MLIKEQTCFINIYWAFYSMAADALAPCRTKAAAAVVFNVFCWQIRVLDSVKYHIFANYMAFATSKMPWVCVCTPGRLGENMVDVLNSKTPLSSHWEFLHWQDCNIYPQRVYFWTTFSRNPWIIFVPLYLNYPSISFQTALFCLYHFNDITMWSY